MDLKLADPVEKLPFVGPVFVKRLEKLKIQTLEDLINHFPFRYDDFSLVSLISRLQPGETVTIRAKIDSVKNEYTKSGKKIQKALVSDSSGQIEIIWFNQPFLIKTLRVGEGYQFSGKVDWFGRKIVFVSPEYERLSTPENRLKSIHTGRLVPVYPETYGLSSKWLRSRIKNALEICGQQVEEFLPEAITRNQGLIEEKKAIFQIHFPENLNQAQAAKERLAFDELLLIQLGALTRKAGWKKRAVTFKFVVDQERVLNFINHLPFELTSAQKKSLKEILADMGQDQPMNRLLQGDVGSGKTVVAAIAMYVCFLNGLQSILMAPTEILANQHYQTLNSVLSPMGIKIKLVTSAHKLKDSDKEADILVGTHALLHQKTGSRVGFLVIDEQHRFGVEQRAQLAKKSRKKPKSQKFPHLLSMTATPIPRTIALTLFGDLDLSVIDELPKGRLEVKTWVVPPQKRQAAYQWIKDQVFHTQQQAFIICPLIEESESLTSVKAATTEFEYLSKTVFPNLKLALLHGRLGSAQKEEIINKFRKGEIAILVSTPVVEVGIDIPKATIMMVEGAERFGLAQLHQLRGRVGRSNLKSYCLLFTENQNPEIVKRLKYLENLHIGMELAEIDLRLRGPGEIYGTRQHGFPDLRIASFTDLNLIEKTRQAAELLIVNQLSLIDNPNSPLNQKLQKYKIQETISN